MSQDLHDERSIYSMNSMSEVEEELLGDENHSTSAYLHEASPRESPRSFDKSDEYSYSFDDDEGPVNTSGARTESGRNAGAGSATSAGYQIQRPNFRSRNDGSRNTATSRTVSSLGQHTHASSRIAPAQSTSTATTNASVLAISASSAHKQVVIEEISNEVLQLRDQQRGLLKMRLQLAREKKERAELRRRSYENHQMELERRIRELESENRRLVSSNEKLEKRRSEMDAKMEKIRENAERINKNENNARDEMTTLKKEMASKNEEILSLQSLLSQERKNSEEECIRLKLEFNEVNVKMKFMDESMKKLEEDYLKKKETLPDHHNNILMEKMANLQMKEDELNNREKRHEKEVERISASLDESRRELMESAHKGRQLTESILADERRALENRWKDLETQRSHQVSLMGREKAALDARSIEINARESRIADKERELELEQQRHASEVQLVEPKLQSVREIVERAKSEKDAAEKVRKNADEYAASVLAGEKALKVREDAVQSAIAAIEHNKSVLMIQSKNLQMLKSNIDSNQEKTNRERFRLHESAMQLSNQFMVLKSMLRKLKKSSHLSDYDLAELEMPSSENSVVVRSDDDSLSGHEVGNYTMRSTDVAMKQAPRTSSTRIPLDDMIELSATADNAANRLTAIVAKLAESQEFKPLSESIGSESFKSIGSFHNSVPPIPPLYQKFTSSNKVKQAPLSSYSQNEGKDMKIESAGDGDGALTTIDFAVESVLKLKNAASKRGYF